MRPAWSKSETPSIAGLRYACVRIPTPTRTSTTKSVLGIQAISSHDLFKVIKANPEGFAIHGGDRQMSGVARRRWSGPPGSHHARPLPETARSRRPPWLTTTSTRVIAPNLNSASDRRERDLGLSGELSF